MSKEETPTQPSPKAKPQSKPQRWVDAAGRATTALQDLLDMQADYQGTYDNMTEGLQQTPYGQKLQAMTELDLQSAFDTAEEASNADLPLGFGRD